MTAQDSPNLHTEIHSSVLKQNPMSIPWNPSVHAEECMVTGTRAPSIIFMGPIFR